MTVSHNVDVYSLANSVTLLFLMKESKTWKELGSGFIGSLSLSLGAQALKSDSADSNSGPISPLAQTTQLMLIISVPLFPHLEIKNNNRI